MSERSNRANRYKVSDMLQVRLWPLVLMLTMTACAGSMGEPKVDTATVAPPVTAFDGSYRSTIRVTGSFGATQTTSWCDTPGQPIITVANGQFSYAVPHPNVPGNPAPAFPATMAQDGSFYGQLVGGTISGQVRGTHMEGSIDGSACLYAFTGDRM